MKRIVVTTDFSANSKAGLRFALQLASQMDCEIFVYHVMEMLKPISWSEKEFEDFTSEKISVLTEKLEGFTSKIRGLGKHVIHCQVEAGPNIHEAVIHYAKTLKAHAICTSTRGAGKFKKLFGTYSSGWITSSPIPVLVIPKDYKAKSLSNVFYASDFSSLTHELETIEAFTTPLQAKINVFHYDYLVDVYEVQQKLEHKIAHYQSDNVRFNLRKLQVEKTLADHLRQDIKKEKPSMVVLFTKPNRNWFDRLFQSSESVEMAFNSKVPLLVFRKKG